MTSSKTKVAIVGLGFVGNAQKVVLDETKVEVQVVDPARSSLTVEDLDEDTDFVFVCVPTPVGPRGVVDSSIVRRVVTQVATRFQKRRRPTLIVRSTVTPDVLADLADVYDELCFMPEFLTEANAIHDALNPWFHVIGSNSPMVRSRVQVLVRECFQSLPAKTILVGLTEASLIKYGVNSFLATKVTFFDGLRTVVEGAGGSWEAVRVGVSSDPRVGPSHTMSPGHDLKRGFGGSCFVKDTLALVRYSQQVDEPFYQLSATITINNETRKSYDLSPREISQGVNFSDYGDVKIEWADNFRRKT